MVVLGGLFDLNDTLIYCTVTIVICYLGHCNASAWCHAVLQCTAGVSVTIYFLVHFCSQLHCMEYTTQNAINFVSSIENTPLGGSSTICGIAYPECSARHLETKYSFKVAKKLPLFIT